MHKILLRGLAPPLRTSLKRTILQIGIAAMTPKRISRTPRSEGAKRTRGRPQKAEGEKRTASLPPLRLTPDELSFIEEQAAIAGMAVSTYAREALTKRVVKPRQTKSEAALLLELNRGGVNLHQIARHLNFGKGLPNDIQVVLDEYRAVLAAVGRAYDA